MIKYSKAEQQRLDANRKTNLLMAKNDLNISNKRQGMIMGEIPKIEDTRSYAEQMNDEVLQIEELNNNARMLMSIPEERQILMTELKALGLVGFFNNNFLEIYKVVGKGRRRAVDVINTISKMSDNYDETHGVSNNPLQSGEFRETLNRLIKKLEVYLFDNKGKPNRVVNDTVDRLSAVSQVLEAREHNTDNDSVMLDFSYSVDDLQEYADRVDNGDVKPPPFIKGITKKSLENKLAGRYEEAIPEIQDDEAEEDEEDENLVADGKDDGLGEEIKKSRSRNPKRYTYEYNPEDSFEDTMKNLDNMSKGEMKKFVKDILPIQYYNGVLKTIFNAKRVKDNKVNRAQDIHKLLYEVEDQLREFHTQKYGLKRGKSRS